MRLTAAAITLIPLLGMCLLMGTSLTAATDISFRIRHGGHYYANGRKFVEREFSRNGHLHTFLVRA